MMMMWGLLCSDVGLAFLGQRLVSAYASVNKTCAQMSGWHFWDNGWSVLTPAQIKPKSFGSRLIKFFFFLPREHAPDVYVRASTSRLLLQSKCSNLWHFFQSRHRNCMKVDVAVLGSRPYCSPYGHLGRKATWNLNGKFSELRSCVKFEVAVLGSPPLIVYTVSVDAKQC